MKAGADGMDPNDPERPIEVPPNTMIITMDDGCTADAIAHLVRDVPNWMQPHQAHPEQFLYYVRATDHRVNDSGFFWEPFNPFERHDPTRHTPRSAQIHIRFYGSRYFVAGPFEVYPLQEQQGPTPPDNYIYIAVPHGQVYRAHLRFIPYEKSDHVVNIIHPGIPPKRRRIIHPHSS